MIPLALCTETKVQSATYLHFIILPSHAHPWERQMTVIGMDRVFSTPVRFHRLVLSHLHGWRRESRAVSSIPLLTFISGGFYAFCCPLNYSGLSLALSGSSSGCAGIQCRIQFSGVLSNRDCVNWCLRRQSW